MKQQTYCQSHQGLSHQFIILNQGSAKLACGECISLLQDNSNKVDFGQIISIQKALTSPDALIQKLTSQDKFSNLFQNLANLTGDELRQEFANLESSLRQLQMYIDQVIIKAKSQVDLIIETRITIKTDMIQKIKYPQFVKLLEELGNSQQDGQIDIYQQIEQKLSQHLNEVNQGDTVIMNLIKKLIKNYLQIYITNGLNGYLDEILSKHRNQLQEQLQNNFQIDDLKIQIDQCLQKYQNLFSTIKRSYMLGLIDITKSTLVSDEYLQDLMKMIINKNAKMISMTKLIFQGTKDGLNSNSFWNKVNNKSNLLMIFKTKKDVVFGAYTPCKWESNINTYVEDHTKSSFIFSYKDKQIYCLLIIVNQIKIFFLYPIKESKTKFAIYCSLNYGPTFGGGFDIQIGQNFQSGQCKLGMTYQVDQQPFNCNLFFGQQMPLIVECEIYEIL